MLELYPQEFELHAHVLGVLKAKPIAPVRVRVVMLRSVMIVKPSGVWMGPIDCIRSICILHQAVEMVRIRMMIRSTRHPAVTT